MNHVNEVGQYLIDHHETITSAESLTAGMFSSTLASVSGISVALPGAFVTYSAQTKASLVDVSEQLIEKFGVVSEEVATAMARGAQSKLKTDWAVSFTGVAGPDKLEDKPAGTVFIGVALPDHTIRTKALHLRGTREEIRTASVQAGFDFLMDCFE